MAKSLGWYIPQQLTLKITLAGSSPAIWRRVEVHNGLTLHDLHYVIQNVFEWTNSHLYHFLVPPGGKLTRSAMREAIQYHMQPPDPFLDGDAEQHRSDEIIVGRAFKPDCTQIVYEYDFGDSWDHVVKLEKRVNGGDPNHIPVCLAGENAAPLDDMGGIGGYYEFLAALRDEDHRMHEEAIEWLGKDFDPAQFDLDKVNERLKKVFRVVPKRPRKSKKKKG